MRIRSLPLKRILNLLSIKHSTKPIDHHHLHHHHHHHHQKVKIREKSRQFLFKSILNTAVLYYLLLLNNFIQQTSSFAHAEILLVACTRNRMECRRSRLGIKLKTLLLVNHSTDDIIVCFTIFCTIGIVGLAHNIYQHFHFQTYHKS